MSRPEILYPLFEPVHNIKGVGTRSEALLKKLGLTRVRDLLFYAPDNIVERVAPEGSLLAYVGKRPILEGEVGGHIAAPRPAPYRVRFHTDFGDMDLVFFKAHKEWLAEQLPIGAVRFVSGKLDEYKGRFQMAHPDYIAEDINDIPRFEAQYGLTEGLSQKQIRKIVDTSLDYVKPMPEWQRNDVMTKYQWPAWDEAVRALHQAAPLSEKKQSAAYLRLAYDELLAHQLTLALIRAKRRVKRGKVIKIDQNLVERAKTGLPYVLTSAQARAIDEIYADFEDAKRSFRLLQGDVGAGKTAVAFLAMVAMAGAGLQSALIAPTEILARQHYANLRDDFAVLGFETVLLTSAVTGAARKTAYEALRSGKAMIAIGTHALLQDAVDYHALGLAVIDEQHRFGVKERAVIAAKGQAVDVLAMSATPIPRSLAMASYGEMDISILDEKPAGRKPVQTSIISAQRMDQLIERLRKHLQAGHQAYWVCPLVQESEKLDYAAAQARFADLQKRLPELDIGLVHGQMASEEKDAVMARFQSGEIALLVATTAIEVGVDVPNATIMAIEGAERFGLSQLHQLRGRVGRGGDQSYCILIYGDHLGETAQARLETIRQSEDGFVIAAFDMRTRGVGDLLGTAQSGVPIFRFADLESHGDLLEMARDDARIIVETDAELASNRGAALRILLYLHESEQAVSLLQKS